MSNLDQLLTAWHEETRSLPWGVQKYFVTALESVYLGKTTMSYGRNYGADGSPCLVNTVSNVLSVAGENRPVNDQGLPSSFGRVVSLFDQINHQMAENLRYDGPNHVLNETAYLLLTHFGPVKTVEEATAQAVAEDKDMERYIEKTDEQILKEWINSAQQEAPSDDANHSDSISAPEHDHSAH